MSNIGNESPGFKLFGKTIVTTYKELEDVAAAETTSEESEEIAEKSKTKRAHLPCPRCRSKDTKFCYFNNYNVNQPRHFCKACHRYWTAGGALRNVPVGAGRRKNRMMSTVPTSHDGGSEGGGICLVGGRGEVERWLRS